MAVAAWRARMRRRLEHLVPERVAAPQWRDTEEPSFVDERMSGERTQALDARPVGIGQPRLGLENRWR